MSHNSIIKKIIVKLHLYTGLILGLVITLYMPLRHSDRVQAGT